MLWLAIVGIVFAVIGAFYYLRVMKVMYFDEPEGEPIQVRPGRPLQVVFSINAISLLVLGFAWSPSWRGASAHSRLERGRPGGRFGVIPADRGRHAAAIDHQALVGDRGESGSLRNDDEGGLRQAGPQGRKDPAFRPCVERARSFVPHGKYGLPQ